MGASNKQPGLTSARRTRRAPSQAALVPLTLLVLLPIVGVLLWEIHRGGALSFKQPWVLWGGLLLPAFYLWLVVRGARRRASIPFPTVGMLSQLQPGFFARLLPLPPLLRLAAVTLLLLALARPQTPDRAGQIHVEGIDIMLVLDLSQSMEATDLRPNRLEAAKQVLDDFIARRRSDRIGLVVFGKEAFTHCPLTLDYAVLRNMLQSTTLGLIDGSATAIGNALGLALSRLRASDAESRVIILLTDGENNAGNIAPEEAARYAQTMGVKVFTILIGPQPGSPPRMERDIFGRLLAAQEFPVNPELLEAIATQTGGAAFVATDRRALEKNFEDILDTLNKTARHDVAAVYRDAYRPLALLALLLLLLQAGLRLTRLREFP